MIEILSAHYVSGPCWEDVTKAADSTDTVVLNISNIDDPFMKEKELGVFQFFFSSYETAMKMAFRVQSSARDKRKGWVRDLRLVTAGGAHNKEVLERLFAIQQCRCYYTGDPLIKTPKNYVVDHIQPICFGGTDWPGNLALAIKEVNTWKGGHLSFAETLQWLSKTRGRSWLAQQKKVCLEIDRKRAELDLEFRSSYGQS